MTALQGCVASVDPSDTRVARFARSLRLNQRTTHHPLEDHLMYPVAARVGRGPLALRGAALAACADDPAAARVVAPAAFAAPNAAIGDVITVTTASGGTEVGSLRWAASQAGKPGDVVSSKTGRDDSGAPWIPDGAEARAW